MIAIIDYDAGNIKSVEKACRHLGYEVISTRDERDILSADHIILPGVGAFGDAMAHLNGYGLSDVIRDAVKSGIPFLGICLGLQVLFEKSEESPGVEGMGILKGQVKRIPEEEGLKVPHIGWNDLELMQREGHRGRLFADIEEHPFVYFVHSYYLEAADCSIVTATAEYGVTIHASVECENVFACQFHPEKSSAAGLLILKNFCEI